MSIIDYPFDSNEILKRKKAFKRQLVEQNNLLEKRVAILSGSTIGEIKDVLELFLLNFGIRPQFYTGQYNRFYEDIMFENQELADFKPDVILIHTTVRNLSDDTLLDKLHSVWGKAKEVFSCPLIQNNFELPFYGFEPDSRKINKLNVEITDYAKEHKDFYVNDIQHLSAVFGIDEWFKEQDYFLYKYACNVNAIPMLCHNIAIIIKSIYGKNQKCLILDLDNTLWGGEIGDVGSIGIELGMETAFGEAYIAFQRYAKNLHNNGIILTVCSKNDEHIAKEAFNNPNMILRLEDIAVFCANWDSKAENILKIAEKLNILPESMVFIDDNPLERELIRRVLPEVKVPEVNSVVDFIKHIERGGYFHTQYVSNDDLKRNEYFTANIKRDEAKKETLNYAEYLKSLQMKSEVRPFNSVHLDRITQLINKTNQFNLTAKRVSLSEVEKIATDPKFIALYATLDDKFGSNGIVSALVGELIGNDLHIRIWVMSCRVFKRDLELAIFYCLVERVKSAKIKKIIGYYYPTSKNEIVCKLYEKLGFTKSYEEVNGNITLEYAVNSRLQKCKNIKII